MRPAYMAVRYSMLSGPSQVKEHALHASPSAPFYLWELYVSSDAHATVPISPRSCQRYKTALRITRRSVRIATDGPILLCRQHIAEACGSIDLCMQGRVSVPTLWDMKEVAHTCVPHTLR
jgi:hypothetical protein